MIVTDESRRSVGPRPTARPGRHARLVRRREPDTLTRPLTVLPFLNGAGSRRSAPPGSGTTPAAARPVSPTTAAWNGCGTPRATITSTAAAIAGERSEARPGEDVRAACRHQAPGDRPPDPTRTAGRGDLRDRHRSGERYGSGEQPHGQQARRRTGRARDGPDDGARDRDRQAGARAEPASIRAVDAGRVQTDPDRLSQTGRQDGVGERAQPVAAPRLPETDLCARRESAARQVPAEAARATRRAGSARARAAGGGGRRGSELRRAPCPSPRLRRRQGCRRRRPPPGGRERERRR